MIHFTLREPPIPHEELDGQTRFTNEGQLFCMDSAAFEEMQNTPGYKRVTAYWQRVTGDDAYIHITRWEAAVSVL